MRKIRAGIRLLDYQSWWEIEKKQIFSTILYTPFRSPTKISIEVIKSKVCRWQKSCFEEIYFEVFSSIFHSVQIVWRPKRANLLQIISAGQKNHLKTPLQNLYTKHKTDQNAIYTSLRLCLWIVKAPKSLVVNSKMSVTTVALQKEYTCTRQDARVCQFMFAKSNKNWFHEVS